MNPQWHLVEKAWSQFAQFVRSHEGWDTRRVRRTTNTTKRQRQREEAEERHDPLPENSNDNDETLSPRYKKDNVLYDIYIRYQDPSHKEKRAPFQHEKPLSSATTHKRPRLADRTNRTTLLTPTTSSSRSSATYPVSSCSSTDHILQQVLQPLLNTPKFEMKRKQEPEEDPEQIILLPKGIQEDEAASAGSGDSSAVDSGSYYLLDHIHHSILDRYDFSQSS